jgi:ABC-type Zn uptake system ZnuABC Zn-binding protein ZnuA
MNKHQSFPFHKLNKLLIIISLISITISSCASRHTPAYKEEVEKIKVLATVSFLADVTRNISGDRAEVISLIPTGLDPHSFEATPQDLALISNSNVLVINGTGFEEWLEPLMDNLPDDLVIIDASRGLTPRQPGELERIEEEIDPHFWLDPTRVIYYAGNIRDGLSAADPAGKNTYTQNAAAFIKQLQELDAWIVDQINTIPPERRVMVTNHESFGYFADRYGLRIVGAILPGVTTGAAPSARHLADLVTIIKQENVPAVFLEAGANPELADQLASETGVKVVTSIYSHSVTEAGGAAPTYLKMIRANTESIVQALKE